MSLKKRAKILSKKELTQVLDHIKNKRYPIRDKVMVLLSFKAGLRAMEIANLKWEMVTDASGNIDECINLTDDSSKGDSGGVIHMNHELKDALSELYALTSPSLDSYVIKSSRGTKMYPCNVAHWFKDIYKTLRLNGCSSHSGRRTFITSLARDISKYGGSIKDVQMIARHKSLYMTQTYIEHDVDAIRKVIQSI